MASKLDALIAGLTRHEIADEATRGAIRDIQAILSMLALHSESALQDLEEEHHDSVNRELHEDAKAPLRVAELRVAEPRVADPRITDPRAAAHPRTKARAAPPRAASAAARDDFDLMGLSSDDGDADDARPVLRPRRAPKAAAAASADLSPALRRLLAGQ